MMTRIWRLAQRIDAHWTGDLLGVVFLFAGGYGALLIGWAVGLK